ncbi:MAG: ComEC family competence protein [Bacteroidetes bacterium]|nr:MAG: ComEC family competence protein [Bacteroidota bacterium]
MLISVAHLLFSIKQNRSMRAWNSFPMLRVIFPFILGVVSWAFIIEWYLPDPIEVLVAIGSIGFLIATLFFVAKRGRKPHLFGLLLWPTLYITGGLLAVTVSDHLYPNHLLNEEHESTFVVRVCEEPRQRTNSTEVMAEVMSTDGAAFGKVLFYFAPDSAAQTIRYGQMLLVQSTIELVRPQGNPNEFNYARYLRFHKILHRGFVSSDRWVFLSDGDPDVWRWFYNWRRLLIQKFSEAQIHGQALSVASALILGYRAELDKELMAAYAGAGATHVLAVSGLHVGIVYVVINYLLKFMDRRKYLSILKLLLMIVVLFGYAALTGMSASVFRAATMFAFVAFGKAIGRDTNIYNTLAASAFCLIVFNPMIVMQVGFQLSYAAVLGIVVIQPWLFRMMLVENRLLDWAWSITCVSVAAQIATFPLGLLYFHQFPNFFWVSNLLVIPAAALILYLGLLLFTFSWWQPALLFFGFLLQTVIDLLNKVVVWIERIPYSVLSGIDISVFETVLIYAIIISVLYSILLQNVRALQLSLAMSLLLAVLQIIEVYEQKHQRFITVYNVRGETVMALFSGSEVTSISSSDFQNDENAKLFNVYHHWWKRGAEHTKWVELNDSLCNRSIAWNGLQFAILRLDSLFEDKDFRTTDSIDFAIIDHIDWKQLDKLNRVPTERILVSNKVGPKTQERLSGVPGKKIEFVTNGAIHIKPRQ